ncbi:MAG: class I SAM-dependent methyltransferase [Thiobacillaceae bacterium]
MSSTPEKITLNGVPETLLVPLFYRAKETQSATPLIRDTKAVEIIKTLDYDFSRCNKWSTQACVVVRTRLFQDAILKFLNNNPRSVVINLAAGLDNRFTELDNGQVRWFDLDLPEVIDVRKRYIIESDRRTFIASDVLDFSWIDQLGLTDSTLPVLVVAEGLLPYLPEDKARQLLSTLADRFQTCQIVLEIFGSFVVGREWCVSEFKHIKPVPKFYWSPRDPRSLETWDKRFKTLAVEDLFSHYPKQWRMAWHLFKRSPAIRNLLGSRVVTLDLNAA